MSAWHGQLSMRRIQTTNQLLDLLGLPQVRSSRSSKLHSRLSRSHRITFCADACAIYMVRLEMFKNGSSPTILLQDFVGISTWDMGWSTAPIQKRCWDFWAPEIWVDFQWFKMWISLLSNFLKRSKRMVITLNIVFSWGWMKLQQNSDLRLGCSTISCRANKVQVGLIQIKENWWVVCPGKRTKKIADLSDLWLKDMFWGTCAHRRTAAWNIWPWAVGHPYAPSQVYSGFCRETYGATSRGDIEPPKNLPMMSAYHFYNS